MTEIIITSGARSWRSDIKNVDTLFNQVQQEIIDGFIHAFNTSVQAVMNKIRSVVLPKVARDSGLMRSEFMKSFIKRFGLLHNRIVYGEFEFDYKVLRVIVEYIRHHVIEDPEFNKNFGGRYKNPTTEGTQPISLIFWNMVVVELHTELTRNILLQGLDIE